MSGLSISDLPWPPEQWRVDLHSPDFETIEFATKEDALRARMLRKLAKNRKGKQRKRLLDLADWLDPIVSPATPQTPASSRYMREQRIRIIGALWRLIDADVTGKVVRYDVVKPKWWWTDKDLRKRPAAKVKNEFRADLLRAAKIAFPFTGPTSGCLFAAFHGDLEEPANQYQGHYHVLATGDWVDVIEVMRELKAYLRTDRVKRPIRKRRKVTNFAYALTYLLKAYWPGTWRGHVSGTGTVRRSRDPYRIPEPYHSELMLWMHRQKLGDQVLLMGIKIRKVGLVYR